MNLRINQEIRYQEEPPGADVWQTPEETWAIKSGDCEDYAILKYALLMEKVDPSGGYCFSSFTRCSMAENT